MKHYTFRERLKSKSEEYGNKVEIVNESFTSKKCFNCGNIKKDLDRNRVYDCKKCNVIIDRDLNGAINIFYK
jgi:putative transposase